MRRSSLLDERSRAIVSHRLAQSDVSERIAPEGQNIQMSIGILKKAVRCSAEVQE